MNDVDGMEKGNVQNHSMYDLKYEKSLSFSDRMNEKKKDLKQSFSILITIHI